MNSSQRAPTCTKNYGFMNNNVFTLRDHHLFQKKKCIFFFKYIFVCFKIYFNLLRKKKCIDSGNTKIKDYNREDYEVSSKNHLSAKVSK